MPFTDYAVDEFEVWVSDGLLRLNDDVRARSLDLAT